MEIRGNEGGKEQREPQEVRLERRRKRRWGGSGLGALGVLGLDSEEEPGLPGASWLWSPGFPPHGWRATSAHMQPGWLSLQLGPLAIYAPWAPIDGHFCGQHRCDKKVTKKGMQMAKQWFNMECPPAHREGRAIRGSGVASQSSSAMGFPLYTLWAEE